MMAGDRTNEHVMHMCSSAIEHNINLCILIQLCICWVPYTTENQER
jgi:hypothetical protein